MAAAKGKLNVRPNKVAEANTKNFKIYLETENDRDPGGLATDCIGNGMPKPARRISVPANERTTQPTASHTKVTFQNVAKSQNECDSLAKFNVKRNVLADVSNTRGSFSRKEVHDGSKPAVSSGRAAQNASASSRKIFMGKLKANPSEDVGDHHKLKKGVKDKNASLNKLRSKGQGSVNTGRMGAKNRPVETRNSLPVLKRVDKVVTSGVKTTDTISKNVKEGYRFSVKGKPSQKVPQVIHPETHPRKNQSCDGFIAKVPKGQINVDSCAFSRKSSRPITKTSVPAFNAQRTLKSNRTSSLKKLLPVSKISSKRKEEAAISIPSESVTLMAHSEPTQGEDPFESSNNLSMKPAGAIARKKTNRRRSFTSFLMSGSKVLEKHAEIMKQDEVPSIYDSSNHLEVSEYVDEIYQHYWVTEAQDPCLADYMKIQTELAPQMRGILINWLSEVHFRFDLMQETLYLTITLLDRYLSQVVINKNEMQLVGLTALLLASKYEDFWHPRIKDLISISAESYTRDQLLGMEKLILNKLKFRLNSPTLYVFMLRFLKAAQSDTKLESLAFYLIELCLVEYEALKFKPSLLCASAIYVARHTLQKTPAWTPLLGRHSHYDESQIRDCATMILRFHKAAKTGMLNVTYEKYLRPELNCVAQLQPLDRI